MEHQSQSKVLEQLQGPDEAEKQRRRELIQKELDQVLEEVGLEDAPEE